MKHVLLAVLAILLGATVGRVLSHLRQREFRRIERRLNEAQHSYPAARFNQIRADLGWSK